MPPVTRRLRHGDPTEEADEERNTLGWVYAMRNKKLTCGKLCWILLRNT